MFKYTGSKKYTSIQSKSTRHEDVFSFADGEKQFFFADLYAVRSPEEGKKEKKEG